MIDELNTVKLPDVSEFHCFKSARKKGPDSLSWIIGSFKLSVILLLFVSFTAASDLFAQDSQLRPINYFNFKN
jgi:hypothetical protein